MKNDNAAANLNNDKADKATAKLNNNAAAGLLKAFVSKITITTGEQRFNDRQLKFD